ncbi:type VI secretion system-associated FHA domain protein TagH [Mangrovicoccus sp. HB161399]|uniref:type VI secretion system-associated FHA domain protein TagH n=1 Tax=Mangrovicoccus sp. HB161399 TaxID=2720392 RepID=UPI001557F339|nr:type VI secretion system-associated FHA domain protein TagH [Mangrovicoccus sp. HB161399]
MPVTVKFQSTGTVPGDGRPVEMRGGSLTIGRGAENDVVLPDPDRMISGRHCAIEDQNGNLVVVDFSTNGTFLNYGKVRLGPAPTPLNDGDILCIGSYELVIEIAADAAPGPAALPPLEDAPPPAARSTAAGWQPEEDGGDFLDDLLGESAKPRGHGSVSRPGPDEGAGDILPPLDPDELFAPPPGPAGPAMPQHGPAGSDAMRLPQREAPQIPDDWDKFLEPGEDAAPPPAAPGIPEDTSTGDPLPAPPPVPERPERAPEPPQEVPAPAAAPAGGDALLASFLAGAGMEGLAVPADEAPKVMARVGRVFRGLVEGLRETLMARTMLKSEFRIETTMISPRGNNPLKFSVTPETAVEGMISPSRGFLDPEEAAREAIDDITAHQVAMVTGMEAALKGVLAELDPAKLEGRIAASGGLGSMFKGKKARYWEAYEQLYGEIAGQAETDFHEVFAREFGKAYQAQLRRLKEDRSRGS